MCQGDRPEILEMLLPAYTKEKRVKGERAFYPSVFADGQGRNRTADTVIFSHVLYQLSYLAGRLSRASGKV
jgi:hypothetical protein